MREPKKESVIIPSRQDLNKLKRKKKQLKLVQKQSILYGIDILNHDSILEDNSTENRESHQMQL